MADLLGCLHVSRKKLTELDVYDALTSFRNNERSLRPYAGGGSKPQNSPAKEADVQQQAAEAAAPR